MTAHEYFFPDPDYIDAIFGAASPCCLDRAEIDRLSREDGPGWADIWSQVHPATAEELEKYGVYNG
jgi:hypothetical protein